MLDLAARVVGTDRAARAGARRATVRPHRRPRGPHAVWARTRTPHRGQPARTAVGLARGARASRHHLGPGARGTRAVLRRLLGGAGDARGAGALARAVRGAAAAHRARARGRRAARRLRVRGELRSASPCRPRDRAVLRRAGRRRRRPAAARAAAHAGAARALRARAAAERIHDAPRARRGLRLAGPQAAGPARIGCTRRPGGGRARERHGRDPQRRGRIEPGGARRGADRLRRTAAQGLPRAFAHTPSHERVAPSLGCAGRGRAGPAVGLDRARQGTGARCFAGSRAATGPRRSRAARCSGRPDGRRSRASAA